MISPKHLAGLILSSLLIVSCVPAYPPGHQGGPPQNPANQPIPSNEKTIKQLERELADRKAEEKRRREAQARAAESNNPIPGAPTSPGAPNVGPAPDVAPSTPTPTTNKKVYRTARKIPAKPGYVFNPYTGEPVDVRGIPSGSLVQDPNDPNKSKHRFRVP